MCLVGANLATHHVLVELDFAVLRRLRVVVVTVEFAGGVRAGVVLDLGLAGAVVRAGEVVARGAGRGVRRAVQCQLAVAEGAGEVFAGKPGPPPFC